MSESNGGGQGPIRRGVDAMIHSVWWFWFWLALVAQQGVGLGMAFQRKAPWGNILIEIGALIFQGWNCWHWHKVQMKAAQVAGRLIGRGPWTPDDTAHD